MNDDLVAYMVYVSSNNRWCSLSDLFGGWLVLLELIVVATLLIASVYDLRENRIPNELWLLAFIVSLLFLRELHWYGVIMGAFIGFTLYAIKYFRAGDTKAVLYLGVVTNQVVNIFLASVLLVLSLNLLRGKGLKDRTSYPYMPFLCGGYLIIVIGDELWEKTGFMLL